jgi:Flp pilus assembly protein TadG
VVEFAILKPFFMIMCLGLVEFGFLFNNYQDLEYARRAPH